LELAWELDGLLARMTSPVLAETCADLRKQVQVLAGPGFASRWGVEELPNVRRFLLAAVWRAQKAPDSPGADILRMAEVDAAEGSLAQITPEWPVPDWQAATPGAKEARRLADEYRIHVFAQHIRTSRPVSAARIGKFVAAHTPAG
jgi:ATP-dependent helicase HrpA